MLRNVLLMMALAAPAATAQMPDSSAVPRELVEALMGLGGSRGITVGAVPAGFPPALVPGTGRVLGGMERGLGRMLVAAIRMDGDGNTVIDSMRTALLAAGWRQPRPPEEDHGGFIPSSRQWEPANQFCGDSGYAQLSVQRVRPSGSVLTISYGPAIRNSMCDPRMTLRGSGFVREVTLPSLRVPVGVRVEGGGSGGSSDYMESEAIAMTAMGAIALLDFFHEQMLAGGWTPVTKLGDAEAAIATYRKKDDKARDVFAAVTASRARTNELRLGLEARLVDVRGRN